VVREGQVCSSVSQHFSMAELLKCFSIYRGIPAYVDENKAERQSGAHGDYSSSVNSRTKIPTTLRGTFGIYLGIP
jgi:hypothetical protein